MHLEAKHPGAVALLAFVGHQGRVDLEEDVGEGGAEVGAVDVGVPRRFRVVEVLAFGAVELDGLDVRVVRHAGREERRGAAEDPRAFAEVGFLVFFQLRQGMGVIIGDSSSLPWNSGYYRCGDSAGKGEGLGNRLKDDVPFWLSPWWW